MAVGRVLRKGRSGLLAVVILITPGLLPAAPKPAKADNKPQPSPPTNGDDLFEGTGRKTVKPVPKTVPAKNELAAPAGTGTRFADVWPSEYRVAEADLQLAPAAQNRAKALAEFARGQAADAAGDPDKALEAWRQATSLDPANGELAVKVASELAKRNEPGEAIRLLKDSIAATPAEPRTRIYLSQLYARNLNKPDLALAAAEQAVEVAPAHFPAWVAVLDLLKESGDANKAAALLDKVLKSQVKDADFWLQLGRYLMKDALLSNTGAKPGEAEQRRMEAAFHKAAELKPDDASVLAQTGDFYTLIRDEKKALEFYDRAVKLNQPIRDEATRNLREKHIRALANNGRAREAIPLLEQLVRDPVFQSGNSLFEYLGELYEQTGQPEKAIEQYKQSLALDAAEPRNHINLAEAQLRAKLHDDALVTIEKARKRFPERVELAYALAQILTKAKRNDDALAIFSKIAQEAKGRNEEVLDEDFYFQWGAAAEQAKKFDLAEEKLRKCIEIEPNAPQPYNYLGYMWVERGLNLEEAGKFIRKALEMRPNEGAYLDSLGWYYFKVGKFEDAKRELHNAVNALKEEDSVVYDHLADAYERLGDKPNAIKYWERALKLEPETPEKIQSKITAAQK